MFTGIIEHVGELKASRRMPEGHRLTVDVGPLAERLEPGQSVAVSGPCLTVARIAGREAAFDVVAETLARTTLGRLAPGAKLNLETALRLGDGLDGHLVQGHVDGLVEVARVVRGGPWRVEFAAGAELLAAMAPKGSVAVDGVSLTVADLSEDRFAVALVPTTLARTTLGDLAEGDAVNVEADLIGKYVRRCLQAAPPAGLTRQKLKDAGYL